VRWGKKKKLAAKNKSILKKGKRVSHPGGGEKYYIDRQKTKEGGEGIERRGPQRGCQGGGEKTNEITQKNIFWVVGTRAEEEAMNWTIAKVTKERTRGERTSTKTCCLCQAEGKEAKNRQVFGESNAEDLDTGAKN